RTSRETFLDPDAAHQLIPCDVCHRCFARDRLETHMRVCENKRPQRKIFDMSQCRARGTDLEEFMKTNGRSKTPVRKNNWRQRHEAFIQTMRQGRGSVPPQSASNLNSEYVSCPHCGRRFAPGPAERHIPKCQNIRSRPPPPKQPHSSMFIESHNYVFSFKSLVKLFSHAKMMQGTQQAHDYCE
uniref:C2HC/C3H-type domain-containing protein n=1 Tax=Cyprinus carpio TaxID=7962 RepID=A0A8C1P2K1_CYPCA